MAKRSKKIPKFKTMSLLKLTGVILFLSAVIYFFKTKPAFLPSWRDVFLSGIVIGAINAGLVLSFGNKVYFL
jgi:hypothetical protein